ncbi:hypothetical protein [uncultured Holdemanella sp.]|uniref:hypothetical protein n=1 Tax=uncultured Holdemanella sp. TaxID=1763549 RepID=UPI0026583EBB|nr:hypothetical protein [uncultured Holdemanella sp.]
MNFIKEENLENSLIRKGLVSGLLMSTLALTLLTTSSVIGEESKVYAKSNGKDSNILMRVDTKNGTEELKEEFEKQIQDIEKESRKKQDEPKSVEEMIMEQPDLLNDVQFIQNNYNVVTQIVYSKPSFSQYISNVNALTASGGVYYGPSGKETYYNLNMSGVIDIMRGMGNNDAYWIREDGAKMLGDYVIVAADLNKYPRGTIVDTSIGKGIVCDTGSFTQNSDTQLDIATDW